MLLTYYYEIFYMFLYTFFSYFLCLLLSYYYINILFIYFCYPLIILNCFQKFITLELPEYVYCNFKILFNLSYIFVIPFILYIIFSFFYSSLYKFQIFDLKISLFWIGLFLILSIFLNYFVFFPLFFYFLTESFSLTYLYYTLESRIYLYIKLIFYNIFTLIFLIQLLMLIKINLFYLKKKVKKIIYLIKFRRFLVLLFSQTLIFSYIDIYFNFLILLLFCLYYEFIIFLYCWNIIKSKSI